MIIYVIKIRKNESLKFKYIFRLLLCNTKMIKRGECMKLKKILSFLLLLIPTLIVFKYDNVLVKENSFYIIVMLSFVFMSLYYINSNNINNKQLKFRKVSIFIALLFSLFQVFGYLIVNSEVISFGYKNVISIFINFVLFRYLIIHLLNYLYNYNTDNYFSQNNKKIFFISLAIIILFWLPYTILNLPGIITGDSFAQLRIIYGYAPANNHHPYLLTMFIGLFVKIGEMLGLGANSVSVYTIFQSLFCSITFAYSIVFLNKRNVNKYVIIFCLAFYALYPVYPTFGITLWKDVPFAFMLMWYVMYMMELVENNELFLKNKFKVITLILIILAVTLTRNNGIYVIVLSIPFIMLFSKQYRYKVFMIFIIPVVFNLIITGPIYNSMNVLQSKSGEMLGVPLQQIARANKYGSLSQHEIDELNKFFVIDEKNPTVNVSLENIDALDDLYNPYLSDPVKQYFNNDYYKEHKMDFYKLYFDIIKDNPKISIESTLRGMVGYYYPDYQYWFMTLQRQLLPFNKQNQDINYLFKEQSVQFSKVGIDILNEPVINVLVSRGLATWTLIICLVVYVSKFKKEHTVMFITLLSVVLTSMASPVAGEYRYVYSIFVTLPFLVSFIFRNNKKIDNPN